MKHHTRHLKLRFKKQGNENGVIPATISSDTPFDRGDYVEILDHARKSIDLSRAPLPLIESHDAHKVNIGIVENIRTTGSKLKADVRFGGSDRALELLKDIQSGIVRYLSVGYRVHDYKQTDERTVLVTHWEPYETSIVSVPADVNAQFFRGMNMKNTNGKPEPSRKQRKLEKARSATSNQLEQKRVQDISKIGKRFDAQDLALQAIADGWSVDRLLDRMHEQKHDSPNPATREAQFGRDFQRELSGTSILKAAAYQLPGSTVDSGREVEASQELARQLGRKPQGLFVAIGSLQKRALSKAGSGQNLVGVDHLADAFIDRLHNASYVMSLGADLRSGLEGDVEIPRKLTGSNTGWVDEGQEVPESDIQYDKITMQPKTLGTYMDLTRKMLLQSSPAAEQDVQETFATDLAVEIDRACIAGSGVGVQPLGILGTTGIGIVPTGGTLEYSHTVDLLKTISLNNAAVNQLGLLTDPTTQAAMLATEQIANSGLPIWTWNPKTPGEGMVIGYPARASNNVPAGTVIFGNWADLVIGQWGVVDILLDPYSLGRSGGLRINALIDVDIAVKRPSSFAVINDL